MKCEISGYCVVNVATGAKLNTVLVAEKERPDDSAETRMERRKAEAGQKAQQWMATYYTTETLRAVPCDFKGEPIYKSKPA